jgi:23S rRNA (cytidine1920-2'-O)/16S rRNA (cytidine1409-2'-O)-methyltransferase
MKRLDQLLVELGLAPSRSKAQQQIESGDVSVRVNGSWREVKQASFKAENLGREDVRLNPGSQVLKYVSRGGLKLEHALDRLHLDVKGFRCLDVGISTGGFTDCLLQRGAAEIAGLDVGHAQLHASLRGDPRIQAWEGVNVRRLPVHKELLEWLKGGIDLCVVDVSFISLEHVLPVLGEVLPAGTRLLALVKPQFEVGADHLNRKGIVDDPRLFDDVQGRVLHLAAKYGFSNEDYFPCSVKGQDGNQEFFMLARRK